MYENSLATNKLVENSLSRRPRHVPAYLQGNNELAGGGGYYKNGNGSINGLSALCDALNR